MDKETLINILLHADNIVIIAANENDLQDLLCIKQNSCRKWRLEVNSAKTNIMHIRSKRTDCSNFMFFLNKRDIPYSHEYKYLGCMINEHLDASLTTSVLVDSTGRALSSIITKLIKNKGFPFSVFCTVYQACALCMFHC